MKWIGRAVSRKEGPPKVTGRAQYIDDLAFPDLWYGITIRSSIAHGRVRAIRFEGDTAWKRLCIVQSKDISGKNLIEVDQPYLTDTIVEHPEEAILLAAHPDRSVLERARQHIHIDYERLPPVFDPETSSVIFKSYQVKKGDTTSIWKRKDIVVVEGEYRTGAQEQLYIENNGVIAKASPDEGVTVWGSMQCPYYVHKALVSLFSLPLDRVRVIQTETGGGFGGKEEYPSILAGHAALLSWKCGHPVKMVYDRREDMAATTKRHPSRTRHKTAITRDGKIIAMEIDFLLDGGAYVTLSPVVLSRGTIHAAGLYQCDHVTISSRVVKTNTPPHGAFRGFGAPQSLFALEKHLDRVALRIGLSPDELRRRNFLHTGDTTATGQVIRQKLDLGKLLDQAVRKTNWKKKRKAFTHLNRRGPIRKGIGLAAFLHGAGFTGSGEKWLASEIALEATAEGKVRVLTANTEIGQGTNTIFGQIVAERLGIPYDWVEVAQPDTANVPNSGPTVASRTCMIVGGLLDRAAADLRNILFPHKKSVTPHQFQRAVKAYLAQKKLKVTKRYEQPQHIQWDDKLYQGDAYGAFAWAVYVAEVSVDVVTGVIVVDDFYSIQEVGKVVHPVLARGQIIGGIAQGIGWALSENVVWKDGRMLNNSLTNYIIPTAMDVPDIRVEFVETPYTFGPAGAKGIGELPLDGPAPAIINAVEHALGRPFSHIPLLPEQVIEALA